MFTLTDLEKQGQVSLMHNIQEKDIISLANLYENYSAALFYIISSIIQREEIAEEVLQDTFLKIWQQADKFDAKKGRLFTWMARIARNTAIDRLRSKNYKAGQRLSQVEFDKELNEKGGMNMCLKDTGLKQVIDKLEGKYAEVLEAIYYQGYTQMQTSKVLNISLGTVKTRSRTGLRMMNLMLKSERYLW